MQGRMRSFPSWAVLFAAAATLAVAPPDASAQPDRPVRGGTPVPIRQPGVRPLDPLTEQERAAAVAAVNADARVRELTGGRQSDVAYVELLPLKRDDGEDTPVRAAEVLISVYEGESVGIRAVVDLSRRAVREVARVAGDGPALAAGARGAQVPISPGEVELARGLVLRDARFRQMLGIAPEQMSAQQVTTDVLPITTAEELCPSGRCVELLFRRGRGYLTTTAVVDIRTRTIRYRRGPQ